MFKNIYIVVIIISFIIVMAYTPIMYPGPYF